MKDAGSYDEKYGGKEYYWGKKPSAICDRVIEIMHPSKVVHPKMIDLGCGEGRNAVYFAEHGFDVAGLDISEVGLKKTRKYAQQKGVALKTIKADITAYELTDMYDVIFSTGTLHYLPAKTRARHFQNYKYHTSPRGLNVFSVFVKKPFIKKAPDRTGNEYAFRSGELMSYYWDWEIVYCCEEIFECMSGGIPHKHPINRVIARKPQ